MNLFIHINGMPLPDGGGKGYHSQTFKYLLAMKLFLAILLITVNVSANVYSQKVNISVTNAPLRDVMTQIRQQTGHYFLFATSLLKDAHPVTVTLKQASLDDALKEIFKNQPFTYTIQDNAILVNPKPQNLSEKIKDFFSDIVIRGRVTDENGAPLPGASVKANGKVAITNSEGNFELTGINESSTVEVSYIGYRTISMVASVEFMAIRLSLNSSDLQEVVINKGYYQTTKALNTGNVSMVEAKDLARNPVSNPLIALQAQVPGLFISQTSGVSGSKVNVRLRGQNSLRFDANNPLYIIDGVPFPVIVTTSGAGAAGELSPFANLALNDIEKIEVLKDADATAIYGSRGANGVILITTKKGVNGGTRVSFDVGNGVGVTSNRIHLMKTDQYLAMRRLALANDGVTTPAASDYDLNGKWGDINQYTDWQDLLIGGTAHFTNAQTSVSGGNANTQFIFGGAFRRESTVFPGDYHDQKASTHLSINHKSDNQRFRSSISFSYLNDNNLLPSADFTTNIGLSPNAPMVYNADGTLNWQNGTWVNPIWPTTQSSTAITDNLNGSATVGYEIINGLTINGRFGYTDIKTSTSSINPFTNYNPAVVIQPTQRTNSFSAGSVKTWILEPYLNYEKSLAGGKIEAVLGGTLQQTDQNFISQFASGFSSPSMVTNIAAATSVQVFSYTASRYRYNALYARLGYNYQDQYLINFTGRRDASSRFGPGKQFANFGAIGAAWIFSKQQFVTEKLPVLSFGKLRASYGLTGNDQISDYKFLSTYSATGFSYQGTGGISPTALTNPDYGWETVKKLEAGLDLGFFKDRILPNVSWYQNRTGNQLVAYALPGITGFTSVQANLPAILQNRGTEFELTTQNFQGGHFRWTTSANLSIPTNKLVSIGSSSRDG
ncbi:SusC/RagA family TonB-linked outer membrane protein [Chitinophaga pinensis]|uniref:TonB-dependent receptor plug n=1 Tax=Chitinophaga pinensis (strain ATCC 43595 / DSM 2588 / LMG 13176 / NBRC 15968 / NCIMB 11800 / UQM 2034) TaxID=485918 RepID=A0A979G7F1_CHIPD|nr:SusC/RagA family TonB-linked outer membrane protein [Chitinophaga pinensis]ACU62098.1 TonB-dependent receptor plug [Chitinophaga pinensis DSM 2588]